MEIGQKPDKLSHIKQSLELGSIIAFSDDYISSNEILTKYSLFSEKSLSKDESTIKRAIKTIHSFLNLKIFESKPSFGYRLKKEFRDNRDWILPIFTQYLFISELESLNYFMEPVSFHLDSKSLYYLYLFQCAKNNRKTIHFEYVKYLENEPKIKSLQVYAIIQRGRKLFVMGLDTQNGDVRHYIFTQITKVIKIDLESNYDLPDSEFISNFYSDSIEAYEGVPSQKVVLKLSKNSETFLKKEYFHKSQKFYRDKNGYLLLEMYINNAEELFSLVSRFMVDIEIFLNDSTKEYSFNTNH
ncbi:MAG: WYL domain-containing protein [Leptospiraceae bacterium]|nr:WYL domain-containing protein [Leptospiraceae bacterium]